MLYQLRVDAVKLYYENQGEKLDDSMACARELEYEQYLQSRIPWCKEVAWPELCRYWTSKEYKTNRRRGREARLKSEDIAQNRGGSRPFVEVQQYLEETLGPEKATTLNTYTAMKCGMKNVSTNGNNGAIISNGATMSQKAKKRLDDYTTLVKEKYPDSWEGRELDGELLYEASGGIPHGRVSIGDGAVKKADIKSAARKRNSSAPISLTLREKEQLRRVNEENAELRRDKEMLQQKVDVHGQLITALFKEVGKELPAHIIHILSHGAVSQPEGTNNSSQAGSQAVDGNNDVMHSSEENDTAGNVGDQTVDATNHGGN